MTTSDSQGQVQTGCGEKMVARAERVAVSALS